MADWSHREYACVERQFSRLSDGSRQHTAVEPYRLAAFGRDARRR
jgi:hypothetical protein